MTEIHHTTIAKKDLAAMSDRERRLLLLLCHATNEIVVYQKLILVSGQSTPTHDFVDLVQTGQTFIFMRSLIGKLHEAWDLFRARFLTAREVAELYLPRLNAKGSEALIRLKKHFGRQSPITLIRNGLSFHYKDESDLIEQTFQILPDDEPWQIHLGNRDMNCFYYFAEMVVEAAVIKLTDQKSLKIGETFHVSEQRGFAELCSKIVEVAHDLQILFGECIALIIANNFPRATISSSTKLQGAKYINDLRLPFFIAD